MGSNLDRTRSLERGGTRGARKSAPHLTLVLQAARPLEPPARFDLDEVDEVILERGKSYSAARGGRTLTIALPDPAMSARHARIARGPASFVLEDSGSRNGTLINGQSVRSAALADADLIEVGRTFFLFHRHVQVGAEEGPEGLRTLDPKLARELETLRRVAQTPISIVVTGPTGSGKEVVAREVHALSGRAGPFVGVNCGAIPDGLIESELFGHRRGAFSGATADRRGWLLAAHSGTLFLDELEELSQRGQVALLRALQEREVVPVGDTVAHPIDLRVVAATQSDLAALCGRGAFREDLYARLSGLVLRVPPLRERRVDVGLLTASLLRRLAPDRADRVEFSADAARAFLQHGWPRNVRELERCLETALALTRDGLIELEDLRLVADEPDAAAASAPDLADDEDRRRRDELCRLLAEHRGNLSRVADAMGKKRQQIQKWCRRYGIDVGFFRG
jgi:transcriptional regulator with PAS, ATPase and Fis domain